MAIDNYRFKIILSPRIEELIINTNLNKDIITFLINIIRHFRNYNNSLVLLIPVRLRGYFHNGELKIISSEINNSQSNVIFHKVNTNDDCKQILHLNNNIYDSLANKIFIDCIRSAEFPIFMDCIEIIINKKKCKKEICKKEICNMPINELKFSAFSDSNIKNILAKLADLNISDIILNKKKYCKKVIDDIMFIICYAYSIPIQKYNEIKSVQYSSYFIDDIEKEGENNFKEILFSLFRGIVFEPVKSPKREQYSIDVHPNDTSTESGFKLYRIDVVSDKRTGKKCNSGSKRILFGEKKGEYYVLGYTKKHNFDKKEIKKRIENIETRKK